MRSNVVLPTPTGSRKYHIRPFYTDKSVIGNGDDPWQCFFLPSLL
uniref:Uncharacterized protein n=1 Tax=Anguilla anguilla TaxID=7936 RepID=A0A0E9XYJ5_ANGAN